LIRSHTVRELTRFGFGMRPSVTKVRQPDLGVFQLTGWV